MTMRSIALFAPLLGMLALFVALALEWLTVELVRTAGGANVPSVAINAPGALPRLMAIAVGLILLSGIFWAVQLGVLGFAWARVSFASMVLMGLLGWPLSMRYRVLDEYSAGESPLVSRRAIDG